MIYLLGISLFWSVASVRVHAFEVLGDILGLDESDKVGAWFIRVGGEELVF